MKVADEETQMVHKTLVEAKRSCKDAFVTKVLAEHRVQLTDAHVGKNPRVWEIQLQDRFVIDELLWMPLFR